MGIAYFVLLGLMGPPMDAGFRPPPEQLNRWAQKRICQLRTAVPDGQDPYLMMALALHESGLRSTAVGAAGEKGVTQINCNAWPNVLSAMRLECSDLSKDRYALAASARILTTLRTQYRTRCWGSNVLACYNGGHNWVLRLSRCKTKTCKAKRRAPIRYRRGVLEARRLLALKYKSLVEGPGCKRGGGAIHARKAGR